MVFTLVSGAQDKLSEILDALKLEREQKEKEREEELKRIEEVLIRTKVHLFDHQFYFTAYFQW